MLVILAISVYGVVNPSNSALSWTLLWRFLEQFSHKHGDACSFVSAARVLGDACISLVYTSGGAFALKDIITDAAKCYYVVAALGSFITASRGRSEPVTVGVSSAHMSSRHA